MRITKPEILNRYTSLPILLDILARKEIFLLNPATWEDRNDSFYLERYRIRNRLEAVLAVCFTTRRETFHHWKIFSGGVGGACIEFNKARLLGCVRKVRGTRAKAVTYKVVGELRRNPPDLDQWPFLKRWPFRDEGEFRIIYETRRVGEETKGIPFEIGCIRRITLSPWLPRSVAETIKTIIKQIEGCGGIKVNCSTLIENAAWRAAVT
jgi:hypothetical protein